MSSFKPIILLISIIFISSVPFFTLAENDIPQSVSRTTSETDLLEVNPMMSTLSAPQKRRVRNLRNGIKRRGCRLKLCFLLEGSRFISRTDFRNQKNFADLLLAITTADTVGTPQAAGLCGVAYAKAVRPIIPGLTVDRYFFLQRLHRAKRPIQALRGVAHAGAALRFALNLFNGPQKAKAAKILLFGKSPDLRLHLRNYDVKTEMRTFRSRGGTVCGVSLDNATATELKSVFGAQSHVVSLDGFFDIAEIIVATVATLCDVPCKTDGNGMTSSDMNDLCPK